MVDVEVAIDTIAYITLIRVPKSSNCECILALKRNRRHRISDILLQACIWVELLRNGNVLVIEFLAGGLHLEANVVNRDGAIQESFHVD